MITVTQREIDYARLRYDDLLTEAARARFLAEQAGSQTSDSTRTVERIRGGLRQAVATLVTLVTMV